MEPVFAWSGDLSVDIREIDEQYKVLVGLLNELRSAISGHGDFAESRGPLARRASILPYPT